LSASNAHDVPARAPGTTRDDERWPPFTSPEWIERWWGSFASSEEPFRLNIEGAGTILLQREKIPVSGIPLRALCSPTNQHSPRYELPLESAAEAGRLKEWLAILQRRSDYDVLLLDLVPESSATRSCFEELKNAGFAIEIQSWTNTAVIDLTSGFEAFSASMSRKLRSNTNRAENGLTRMGELVIEDVAGAPDWADWLERAFALEAESWKGEKGTAIAQNRSEHGFYTGVASDARSTGRLKLFVLCLGADLLAFNLIITHGTVCYGLKTGFREDMAKYSPGNVLQRRVVERLCADGYSALDMLDPVTVWKEKWASRTEDRLRIFAYNRTTRARLAYRLRRLGRELATRYPSLHDKLKRFRKG
jgi:hypothetical protein